MKNIIGLKELRENVEKYTKKIQSGESFIVMKHSKVMFKIAPVSKGEWEQVIDFTKIKKGGVSAKELLKRL